MKISYAITVSDEFNEIQTLLSFLFTNKRVEDEIIVLLDLTKNDPSSSLLNYLNKLQSSNNIRLIKNNFNKDFAYFKNIIIKECEGDYIFHLDADEIPDSNLVKNLHELIELNPSIELYWVPRVNIVNGIEPTHIKMWGWKQDDKGRINYPDYQPRIFKNSPNIMWVGKVHERIVGHKEYSLLPQKDEYSLYHIKDIEKQIKQNSLYNNI